jgi:hypothetical protein
MIALENLFRSIFKTYRDLTMALSIAGLFLYVAIAGHHPQNYVPPHFDYEHRRSCVHDCTC